MSWPSGCPQMPQRIKCPAEKNSNQWQYLGCSQISQSWIIVQPRTTGCQLSKGQDLQILINT